jgi:hypothetical protein
MKPRIQLKCTLINDRINTTIHIGPYCTVLYRLTYAIILCENKHFVCFTQSNKYTLNIFILFISDISKIYRMYQHFAYNIQ